MKKLPLTILILMGALTTTATYALNLEHYNNAKKLLQQSVKGDSDATESAFEKFEALVSQNPNNPVLVANLGSIETLLGRDAWMPWTKMSYVESGLDKIDEAIEMIESENFTDSKLQGQWQSILVRNIAANTFDGLPNMFNRSQSAKDEVAELLESDKLSESSQLLKNSIYSVAMKIAEEEEKLDLVEKYKNLIK